MVHYSKSALNFGDQRSRFQASGCTIPDRLNSVSGILRSRTAGDLSRRSGLESAPRSGNRVICQ